MKWIPDSTGRFSKRPFYLQDEIDQICERIVESYLLKKHGKIIYPITTEDLTIMIERDVEYLDLYADFPEDDIEGWTDCKEGEKPKMQIARYLNENPKFENRQRTTLTHEYTHVKIHDPLYQDKRIIKNNSQSAAHCKTTTIISAERIDWTEWQAGYGCGAMLMPITPLNLLIKAFLKKKKIRKNYNSFQSWVS